MSNHLALTRLAAKSRACPHCEHTVFSSGQSVNLGRTQIESWDCPHCHEATVFVAQLKMKPNPSVTPNGLVGVSLAPGERKQVIPAHTKAPRKFGNAPPDVLRLYSAACELVTVYLPAAGAVARKCLEAILRRAGYEQSTIAQQVEALAKEESREKQVSVRLVARLGVLREFGNFAAHEISSPTTGEVIDVEPGEVDLCLVIIEELIDELYERPALDAAEMAAVAERMRQAGKVKVAEKLESTFPGRASGEGSGEPSKPETEARQ